MLPHLKTTLNKNFVSAKCAKKTEGLFAKFSVNIFKDFGDSFLGSKNN